MLVTPGSGVIWLLCSLTKCLYLPLKRFEIYCPREGDGVGVYGYTLLIGYWGYMPLPGWGSILTTVLPMMGCHFQQSYQNGVANLQYNCLIGNWKELHHKDMYLQCLVHVQRL